MSGLGKYLYCIISSGEQRAFDGVVPIGDSSDAVYTVPSDGLSMVVSEAALGQFESTRANLLAHQKVQERVMKEFTLLPVRFGTVAQGASAEVDIQRLLAKRSREFHELLEAMEGKVELGLKVLWRDMEAVFGEIVARNEDIRRLRESIAPEAPPKTRFGRIRLGEMVKEALEGKKRSEREGLLALLRPLARRTVENQVVVDRMMLNAAFLVDMAQEKEFDQVVSQMDGQMAQRLLFRYVGPVPPYNFVNVVVNWNEL